jgi:hypothetical protein
MLWLGTPDAHFMSANHPDKVAQLDPEIQGFASKRSRMIIEAYEAICAGESQEPKPTDSDSCACDLISGWVLLPLLLKF